MNEKKIVLLAAVSLLACGTDDGGDGPGTLTSGLDGGKEISEFTPAEEVQFCENFLSYRQEFETTLSDPFCRIQGLGEGAESGNPAAACRDAVSACKADAERSDQSNNCEIPENCAVTPREMQACVDALGPIIEQLDEDIPACSSAGDQDALAALLLTFLELSAATPQECEVINEKCPGLSPIDPDVVEIEESSF